MVFVLKGLTPKSRMMGDYHVRFCDGTPKIGTVG